MPFKRINCQAFVGWFNKFQQMLKVGLQHEIRTHVLTRHGGAISIDDICPAAMIGVGLDFRYKSTNVQVIWLIEWHEFSLSETWQVPIIVHHARDQW